MGTEEETGKLEKEIFLIDKKEYKKRYRDFFGKHQDDIMAIQKMPYENKISWGSLLERNAREYPDNVAVYFEDKVLTYKEFNELVNQYANYFISLGLKKGDVVEVIMKNRLMVLVVYCANAKIGSINSMINSEQKARTLIHSVTITPCKYIVVGEECWEAYNGIRSELDLPETEKYFFIHDQGEIAVPEGFENLPELVKNSSKENPPTVADVHTMDPLAYIFTSGTTGMPKAAILLHFRTAVYGHYFGILGAEFEPSDIMYICIPFFHGTALQTCWSAAMATGAAVAVGRRFSTSRFWDEIKRYKATAFGYVGEICRYLMNQPEKPDDADNTVKKIIGNGLRPEIWKAFKKRFDIPKVVEFYGAVDGNAGLINLLNFDCTTGTTTATFAIVEYDIENETPIYDEKGFMKKVKVGDAGLLLLKSEGAYEISGYTDKKKTEAKIFRNVFKEGDVWFNTGDLMRDQGQKHAAFVDRLGDTFRWKGHNVSTTEVEELINTHDNVLLSTAYGVKIPNTDGRAGMAAILPERDFEDFDLKGLLEKFKENLPTYAIPLFLRFKSELEITPTFKFKKMTLKEEAFDLDIVNDKLFVLLPGAAEYTPLTKEIYEDIKADKVKF